MSSSPPRKIGRWLLAVTAAVFLYFLLSGPGGLVNIYRSHLHVNRLEEELGRLNTAVESLGTEIERLKHDTLYIEKTAREKLGMAGDGERIYKFIEQKDTDQ
jgi:cell division protein FtsB